MCTVCGCGASRVEPSRATERNRAAADTAPQTPQTLDRPHQNDPHAGAHDHGREHPAAPGASSREAKRLVRVEQDILAENDRLAAGNRAFFAERRILALNLMSAPGSGKTTLLVRTIADLRGEASIAVIEGDQETSFDTERVRATGVPAVQINTGKGCHLDARMVGAALPALQPEQGSVVFIENVGTLVCPPAFDLGEAARVVLL